MKMVVNPNYLAAGAVVEKPGAAVIRNTVDALLKAIPDAQRISYDRVRQEFGAAGAVVADADIDAAVAAIAGASSVNL